ncbi:MULTISPECIES: diaminobutyrate acetyltransferase [Streptomyces]|uniref:diaminobutyrate acetyltransferase n=1 Tax=Streptomyces TaxID=1883 RepID=UPI000CD50A43|nr:MULTISPECIES: diaminobutyrate acetyltransferase [Streptomyces]
MTSAQADHARAPSKSAEKPEGLKLDYPRLEDGAALWRIARDSRVLDLNSSYSYLLWCRDHSATSIVARDADGSPVGFVTGYLRPQDQRTLFVWQVAVDHSQRGRGLAAAMLGALVDRTAEELDVAFVETTVTPDNTPSNRLFTSFAERRGAPMRSDTLFDPDVFPESGHEPEVLHRIGPVDGH